MKPVLYFMKISILITFSTGQVQSERLFRFPELTDEMLVQIDLKDGSVEDWEEILGDPTLTPLDFKTPPETNYDPSSLDFRIWLAWHDATDKLFLAAEFVDDVFLSTYDRYGSAFPPFTDSAVWFFVDGDNSGGRLGEPHSGEEMQQAQIYTAFPRTYTNDSNVTLIGISAIADWVHNPPFADGGGEVLDSHPIFSVLEFYVTPFDHLIPEDPSQSVVSTLFPGKKIKFELEIKDYDTNDDFWDNSFSLVDSWERILNADVWAEGILLGGQDGSNDTAVKNVTLGEIKKNFSK